MKQTDYEPYRTKYNLPSFSELDNEFEIADIEQETAILRNICKNIYQRIDQCTKFIEKIIQPDANSYIDLYECKFFTHSEKDQLFEIFRQLMHANRTLLELDLILDEKQFAEFIKQFNTQWIQMKKMIQSYLIKLKNVWKEKQAGKTHLDYLG